MKNIRTLFIGASLAALTCGVASADQIITTSATMAFGPTTTDFSWNLVFPATATPAGFHLVSATLEIDTSITDSTLTVQNTSGTTQTFDLNAMSADSITANAKDSTLVGSTSSPTVIEETGSITIGSGVTDTYSPITVSEKSGPAAVTNAAGYLAGDTVSGTTLSSTTLTGGGGNLKLTQVQTGTITGEIVFDFAPNTTTPEPTTMVLFGSALIGLGLLRKRARG
jgi:hypothetical protein